MFFLFFPQISIFHFSSNWDEMGEGNFGSSIIVEIKIGINLIFCYITLKYNFQTILFYFHFISLLILQIRVREGNFVPFIIYYFFGSFYYLRSIPLIEKKSCHNVKEKILVYIHAGPRSGLGIG